MNIKIITLMDKDDYKMNGKNFIKSFLKNWPIIFRLEVYIVNMPRPPLYDERLKFVDVYEIDQVSKIIKNNKGIYSRPFNFKKELNLFRSTLKSLIINNNIKYKKYDNLIFLDSCVIFRQQITIGIIQKLCSSHHFVSHFSREMVPFYSDTSILSFNLKNENIDNFVQEIDNIFLKNKIFLLKEYHYNFVFDYVKFKLINLKNINACDYNDLGLDEMIYLYNRKNTVSASIFFNKIFKINNLENEKQITKDLKKINNRYYTGLFFSGLIESKSHTLELIQNDNARITNVLKIENYKSINTQKYNESQIIEKINGKKYDQIIYHFENEQVLPEYLLNEISKNCDELIILYRSRETILKKNNFYKPSVPLQIKNCIEEFDKKHIFKLKKMSIFNRFYLVILDNISIK